MLVMTELVLMKIERAVVGPPVFFFVSLFCCFFPNCGSSATCVVRPVRELSEREKEREGDQFAEGGRIGFFLTKKKKKKEKKEAARFVERERSNVSPATAPVLSREFSDFPPPLSRQDATFGSSRAKSARRKRGRAKEGDSERRDSREKKSREQKGKNFPSMRIDDEKKVRRSSRFRRGRDAEKPSPLNQSKTLPRTCRARPSSRDQRRRPWARERRRRQHCLLLFPSSPSPSSLLLLQLQLLLLQQLLRCPAPSLQTRRARTGSAA